MILSLSYIQLLESEYLYTLVEEWKSVFSDVFSTHPSESLPEVLSLAGITPDVKVFLSIDPVTKTVKGSLCYLLGTAKHPVLEEYKIDTQTAFVYNLFTVPVYQRQGYGKAMMAMLEEELRKQKIAKINLVVLTGNDKAIRFYLKEGFKVRRAMEHGFLMEKHLTHSIEV
jgi:ribosomal protein S18 acetylase RimI-like enzyme